MTATAKATLSYVFIGIGAVLSIIALLLLIATYQHNAAIAAEVEDARAAASHSAEALSDDNEEDFDQEQAFAEIDARAAEARGSYFPGALMLIAGAGSLVLGAGLSRQANAGRQR